MNDYIYNHYINEIINKLKLENCIRFNIKEINNYFEVCVEFYEPVWYKKLSENTKINVIETMNNYYKNIKIHTYFTNNSINYVYC